MLNCNRQPATDAGRATVPGQLNTAARNPFAAQSIRPGAIPYLFLAGGDAAGLADRLPTARAWQIVGGHGSGKSTLIVALVKELRARKLVVAHVELHDGQRRLPKDWRQGIAKAGDVVAVDGYEQLSRYERLRLRTICRWRGWPLIVTAHASVGLPTLDSLEVTPEIAAAVVERLVGDAQFAPGDLAPLLARCQGNLREALFELYDRFEDSRSAGDSKSLEVA